MRLFRSSWRLVAVMLFAIVVALLGFRLGTGNEQFTEKSDTRDVRSRTGELADTSSLITEARAGVAGDARNHLDNESSPYLLMHTDNPVHWYPWGKAAFSRAREEQKPIFLSIGYSTCYWCHVMERESFMDEEVADVLNRNFVSIKVDREERPDVDEIYMNALHLTGQRGGWPLSMFLTPDLKPFVGGTYFPRDHFMQVLERVNRAWENEKARLLDYADELTDRLAQVETNPPADRVPGEKPVATLVGRLRDTYDMVYGGFGSAPKFPQPAKLDFLLTHYEQTGDESILDMVTRTLDAMAMGGIYDQVGRGFHRYSTDNFWTVPHFEKMLYDNAQLLHTYSRAHALTGERKYRRTALEIAGFVDRVMTGPRGMYYSAMDSETHHEEGAYYVWTKEEIRKILDDDQYKLVETVYGFDQPPNFEDEYYILRWSDDYQAIAERLNLDIGSLMDELEPIRNRLLEARLQRDKPLIDDKVIVSWNGLMIQALAYAGDVLGRDDLLQSAETAANALWKHLRPDNELLHVYRNGKAKLPAYLDDYAAYISALMQLHEVTGEQRWREFAVALADDMIEKFRDPDGGFYYAQERHENLIIRTRGGFDGAMPSANSLASQALLKLAHAVDEKRFLPYTAGIFRTYATRLERHPVALTAMTAVLSQYHAADYPRRIALPNAVIDNLQELTGNKSLPASGGPVDQSMASDRHVQLQARLQNVDIDGYQLVASFDISDGWHINAHPASLDFLIPTSIRATVGGRPVNLERVNYPEGRLLRASLPEPIAVYDDDIEIPFTVPTASGDSTEIEVQARVQACNDEGRCLLPATVRSMVSVTQ